VAASLPFAPEIVLPTLRHYLDTYPEITNEYGLVCSSNPTYPNPAKKRAGWLSKAHFALDQGPVLLMIENYRSGLIWRLMRRCEPLVRGLRRAGFASGWLRDKCQTGLSASSRQNGGGPSRSDLPGSTRTKRF
jgi:hypothetical protein